MKIIIRGVFETNSSSTHSLTICSKEEYDAWNDGKVLLGEDGKFYTQEEYQEKKIENKWFDCYTVDDYGNDMEWFEDTYTTKNGDEVVAFGYYGYDG